MGNGADFVALLVAIVLGYKGTKIFQTNELSLYSGSKVFIPFDLWNKLSGVLYLWPSLCS